MGFFKLSGFSLEFFLALGAGNHNLALAPGDADGLAAAGAEKITVLAILHLIQHQAEASVLLIALIDIPGEAAPDGQNHQCITQHEENLANPAALQKSINDARCHTHTQNHHIQAIRAISPGHEPVESGLYFCGERTHPAAEILHTITLST